MCLSDAFPSTGGIPPVCVSHGSCRSLANEMRPSGEARGIASSLKEGTKDPRQSKIVTHHIPGLSPSFMWPRRNAKVATASSALARIDFVEFSHTRKIHGTNVFVLNVYLKRQPTTRIPTNRASRAGSIALADKGVRGMTKPDYVLEKTFDQIQLLRYYSWLNTQPCAKESACEYCAAFDALLQKHYSNATLLALLWPSTAHRKKVLEGFVNAMITQNVHGLSSLHRTRGCEGFGSIPVRLQSFLRRSSFANF